MLNLDGYLDCNKVLDINRYTSLRFADSRVFKTPEALSLYEQNYMLASDIKKLCEKEYGLELFEPRPSFIPDDIINHYNGSGYVPIKYEPMKNILLLMYLPEVKTLESHYPNVHIETKPTTIYYYMKYYQKYYGVHRSLRDIPAKMLFDFVVKEAIEKDAADITISNTGKATVVYYNIRKRKVWSNYCFSQEIMGDIIKFITISSPLDRGSRKAKALDIDLNENYRGRVMINQSFKGMTITIRVLPNAAFSTDITELNLTKEAEEWMLDNILDMEKGLRLIVGETMSGKNTDALSLLQRLVETDRYKIVSVEIPVEQELPGVEQINCDTPDDYSNNIKSLIRVNPDFVYITEMQDATALATIKITNTGKCVLSTVHANSVGDTIVRLMDMTGLPQDRIVQTLHSVVYQELVRDDSKDFVYPRCRYVRFTPELKYQLYGKPLGVMLKIIQDYEEGDVWTSIQHLAQ